MSHSTWTEQQRNYQPPNAKSPPKNNTMVEVMKDTRHGGTHQEAEAATHTEVSLGSMWSSRPTKKQDRVSIHQKDKPMKTDFSEDGYFILLKLIAFSIPSGFQKSLK